MRKHAQERSWRTAATVASAMALAFTLGCTGQPGSDAQRNASIRQERSAQNDGQATLGTRSVTGTVKRVVEDGIVVLGHEKGESEREWAFVLDAATRMDSAIQRTEAGSLREGDSVTVVFTNRDGKIVAQSVLNSPPEISASETR